MQTSEFLRPLPPYVCKCLKLGTPSPPKNCGHPLWTAPKLALLLVTGKYWFYFVRRELFKVISSNVTFLCATRKSFNEILEPQRYMQPFRRNLKVADDD